MATFLVRRAEHRDAAAIVQLARSLAVAHDDSRTSADNETDIELLIDVCPFSAVAASADGGTVYAFVVVGLDPERPSDFPPDETLASSDEPAWFSWTRRHFKCPAQQEYGRVLVLRRFISDPLVATQFCHQIFTTIFMTIPHIDAILRFGAQSSGTAPPFPLCGPRYQMPSGTTDTPTLVDKPYFEVVSATLPQSRYQLTQLRRDLIMPRLSVRKARVEDCDDLMPILRANGMVGEGDEDESLLARQVESESDPARQSLVVDMNGAAVGFVVINMDGADIEQLQRDYVVVPFLGPVFADGAAGISAGATLSDSIAEYSRGFVNNAVGNDLITRRRQTDNNAADEIKLTTAISNCDLASVPSLDRINIEERPAPPPAAKKSTVDLAGQTALKQAFSVETLGSQQRPTNAFFTIELFCVDAKFAGMAAEIMTSLFKFVHSRVDVCFMTLPTMATEPPILREFIRVPPKRHGLGQNLYSANRRSCCNTLTARLVTPADLPFCYDLISRLPYEMQIAKILTAPDRSRIFVGVCQGVIVGLAITSTEELSPELARQYSLDDFVAVPTVQKSGGLLFSYLLLRPSFLNQARRFTMLILAHEGRSFAIISLADKKMGDGMTHAIALDYFYLLQPRRRIEFPGNKHTGKTMADSIVHSNQILAMNVMFEPRLRFTTRIVVVGASSTGLGFSAHLLHNGHLHFQQLVLINDTQLVTDENDSWLVDDVSFFRHELSRLGLSDRVHFIQDTVTAINRTEKFVDLEGGERVSFDYLILTPGLDYSVPESSIDNSTDLLNVAGMNRRDFGKITRFVRRTLHPRPPAESTSQTIVVYGRNLQTFVACNVLLRHGIAASNIALLMPPSDLIRPDAIENAVVARQVLEQVERLGVQIMNARLVEIVTRQNVAVAIKTEDSTGQTADFDCAAVICCHEKSVRPETFRAVNDASLVFDKFIIIDQQFHTNDPFIFAAGPVTKYSTRYRTKWRHSYYNSREVGQRLAEILLQLFDPLSAMTPSNPDELPTFNRAKQYLAKLPGAYYYHFDRPHLAGDYVDAHVEKGMPVSTQMLHTEQETNDVVDNYMRILLDKDGYIESLTYYGTAVPKYDNYACLYEKHEKMLNNMVHRYRDKLIPDLVSFLDQDWATPIYDDVFDEFSERVLQKITAQQESRAEVRALLDRMQTMDIQEAEETAAQVYQEFDAMATRKELDQFADGYIRPLLRE